MRYRGKVNVEFTTGKRITVEHVVNADNIEIANKICAIEFHGSYKHNNRVKEYHIEPCTEDAMERPTTEFVKEKLLIVNDTSRWDRDRQQAKNDIYAAFEAYQPSWDDDGLSDALSYCEDGILEKYGTPEEVAKNLVEELDGLWCCHYMPHLDNLEEQYQQAIA